MLSAGPTPHTPLDEWSFSVVAGDETKSWSWERFRVVYLGGPGAVARCRTCSGLLMVGVDVRGVRCVDLSGLASLEPVGGAV